ncbi:formyltetrahydrofolate deformylase [Ectothiorhodospira lacustris]|uniref:formyltetrahydrofolate deformylase n=1 Tax=Ectothiorhodospira lacustris TaxID=2899127 RepID=UPI001EE81D7F|nr:formyltetrahydrofolate deformylase [Ectothiorhodospira lacustris]MCG5501700.1 formyltetrahydrofolate deformylase [Ectothiorhodospira lacustris]MCG5510250.1 formyltetrahydrofolate deformylase [Ectothiorhodospira lacustris]MCG5521883.1 formyltetrahydrofolate deformylase [Ectothiorhodospira lacustris]
MSPHRYRLIISCPDRVGIVAAVSGFLAGHGGSITEASQHSDASTGWFFMRYEIDAGTLPFDVDGFRQAFEPIAREFAMQWHVTDARLPRRVVPLVSKLDHCLTDLLYRWRSGDLPMDIPCVISNHEDMRDYVEWHGIPYHHVPVDRQEKAAAFARVSGLVDEARADVVVLARYMQILPPDMCARYAGRVINIHHSFLPSFVGARPYHRAFDRGVKLIGATCHYVTDQLDEGPIIEQDVIRVRHDDTVDDLVRLGRDVERAVLARGLRYHLEDRVLVHGNKTVVFD